MAPPPGTGGRQPGRPAELQARRHAAGRQVGQGGTLLERVRYERELSAPLREHFVGCGFEVRSEVNSCDLVAIKPELVVVVELKRHLSFDLLAQAVERQSYADAVYLAIPKPADLRLTRQWRAKLKVLRQLGLGLLLVGGTAQHPTVEEALAPGAATPIRLSARKRRALEREFRSRRLDLNTGGTAGVPLVTAYREAALYLVHLLDAHGPLTPKAARELGVHAKRTAPILRLNHYGWFARGADKRYELTEAGREALVTYGPLISAFRETGAQPDAGRRP